MQKPRSEILPKAITQKPSKIHPYCKTLPAPWQNVFPILPKSTFKNQFKIVPNRSKILPKFSRIQDPSNTLPNPSKILPQSIIQISSKLFKIQNLSEILPKSFPNPSKSFPSPSKFLPKSLQHPSKILPTFCQILRQFTIICPICDMTDDMWSSRALIPKKASYLLPHRLLRKK